MTQNKAALIAIDRAKIMGFGRMEPSSFIMCLLVTDIRTATAENFTEALTFLQADKERILCKAKYTVHLLTLLKLTFPGYKGYFKVLYKIKLTTWNYIAPFFNNLNLINYRMEEHTLHVKSS